MADAAPPTDLERTRTLAARFAATLADTQGDWERMPFFVRPMVRAGFERRTGRAIAAWVRLADDLRRALDVAGDAAVARAAVSAIHPRLADELTALVDHYRGAPDRAARFMGKDSAALATATDRSRGREQTVRDLQAALRAL